MAFRFENLRVWQIAIDLSGEVDSVAKSFPSFEGQSLTLQIKRAADSVVLNIAEGCTGQSMPEYKRFLKMALRSAIEVVSCLFIAKKRKYLSTEAFKNLYDKYEVLCKMITKLKNSMSAPMNHEP